MSASEKVELALAGLVVAAATAFHGLFPHRLEASYFILYLGLLFMFQTLTRDLWLIYRLRSKPRDAMPATRCMCLESAVGFIPVIASAVLLFGGISRPIDLPSWTWPAGATLVLLTGFLLKDYVFEWNPWRIRKDPDHINMRFTRTNHTSDRQPI